MSHPAADPSRQTPTTFADLSSRRPLRPIHDDADLEAATAILDRLAVINAPTPDQADYLRTLTLLVEAYEEGPTSGAGGPELLQYVLRANAMTTADLGRLLGVAEAIAGAIFSGEWPVAADQARKLGERFAMTPAAFVPSGSVAASATVGRVTATASRTGTFG